MGLGGGLAAELCAAQECGEGVDAGDEECEEEENGGGEEKGEGGFGHGGLLKWVGEWVGDWLGIGLGSGLGRACDDWCAGGLERFIGRVGCGGRDLTL